MDQLIHLLAENQESVVLGSLLLSCCIAFLLLLKTAQQGRRLKGAKSRIEAITQENIQLQLKIARLVTLLKNERRHSGDKEAMLEEAKERLSLQFQTLSRQIFEERSEALSRRNREKLGDILVPLQEQLHHFQQKVDAMQIDDARERMSLKKEILHLRDLNQQMNKEAVNLSRALRGDKKQQGNWGEMVLERVLELSGLRKDKEYSVQGGFRDRENRLLKPDVIVYLPDGKHVIIDSKVSLSAWERYIVSDDEDERRKLLGEHIRALRHHITELSEKNYPAITELNSLDFVLLFTPIESSFSAACEADETLLDDAFGHRILVVTPTTLVSTLKTIENLWRFQRQNQHAQEIAERAASLYDKLRGFTEDMEKVGKQLATCTTTYDAAMNKLCRGKGNVIAQATQFTELGVKVKKEIPKTLTSLSDPPN